MESILLELYKRFSQDECVSVKDTAYYSMNDRIKEEREYLIAKLSPEDGERLIKLEALYTDTANIDEAELFCKSFRLAVLLMTEVYST